MRGLMLAGTNSNVGKTTVTMGIMAAFKKKGYRVMPSKTGPDYIDPMFHHFVTGEGSTNLDTWMLAPEMVRTLFGRRLGPKDLAVVEGVMGLYDGAASGGEVGSSAYLSKVLGLPVFLVIDGRGLSTSAAALVKGYADFDPAVKIAGVIVNRIATASHYALVKAAIEAHTGIPCVGWLPNDAALALESRHLGLIPAEELADLREKVNRAADLVAGHIDLDRMAALSAVAVRPGRPDPFEAHRGAYRDLTIAYAWDSAFNFYYHDNLAALKTLGVTLAPFSPLADEDIPAEADGVYLGGGFPEIFGKTFEDNSAFRVRFRERLESGLPCYAECGGLMALTRSLETKTGARYAGVGFLPADTVMTARLQRFGYVDVAATLDGRRCRFKAHEFHHSLVQTDTAIRRIYRVSKRGKTWECGYVRGNTLAGYPHVHFYADGADRFLLALLERVRRAKAAGTGGHA